MKAKGIGPDFYRLQRAKEDYVLVHGHFAAHPVLLDDITTRCIYNSLMAVETPEHLDSWLKAIAKTDLSLANAKNRQSDMPWENALGHYERLLRGLSVEERALLAREMPTIRKGGYEHYFNRDVVTLFSEASRSKGEHPDSIVVLYDQIDNHVAIGADAEKLFERFGWQTATAEVDGTRMSVMPISDDVLCTKGLFDFHLSETTVDLLDIRVADPLEAELSLAQQTIDAFRRSVFHDDIVFPVANVGLQTYSRGIEHDHHYPFVEKLGDSLSLFRADAVRETVVSGQSWNVDKEKVPLLVSLAERLHVLMHDMEQREQAIGVTGLVSSDIRATASYEDYLSNKNLHGGKRLLLDHGGIFETYSDDAVSLAREFQRPLWTRDCGMYGENTMLILSPQMAHCVTEVCDDVVVGEALGRDGIDKMRLRPSILNDYLSLKEVFEDASILVKKDGGYAVRASMDGRPLPMKDIPKADGDRYMSMPDRLAQKVFLNGILHKAYGETQYQNNPLTLHIK